MSAGPQLKRVSADDGVRLVAEGAWIGAHASALEASLEREARAADLPQQIAVDVSGIEQLDTYGAWLLQRLQRALTKHGGEARLTGTPERYRDMLAQVGSTNRTPHGEPAQPPLVLTALNHTGRVVSDVAADLIAFTNMLGALGLAALRVLTRPATFRLTSLVNQLDRVGLQAVPIILLIMLLIGGTLAQQGFFHFRRFGAETYAVDMVGILVLREIGVLIVAIMVAGRSGSSYTAELGSMKMREEIDALRTMGLDPVEVLLLPRVLALVIALPMLAFIGSMAALVGGGLMAWAYAGMSPDAYITRLQEAVTITHFRVGMIKAPFMALGIGVVACMEGLKVTGSAESLGLKTTDSVVMSIFLVIVLDGLFAMFFASIGM